MEAFFHKIGIFFLGKKNTFMGMLGRLKITPPFLVLGYHY